MHYVARKRDFGYVTKPAVNATQSKSSLDALQHQGNIQELEVTEALLSNLPKTYSTTYLAESESRSKPRNADGQIVNKAPCGIVYL